MYTDEITGAVVGYCRVSRPEQAARDKTSIEDQERRIAGAIAAKGWSADELVVFRDEGVSGAIPLKERGEGRLLWEALHEGDILFAAKLDRLFRSAEDALNTATELAERGVRLILLDMGLEPVTDAGPAKMFFTVMAAVAEFERWTISQRMREGRAGKRRNGGHAGGSPPYGFSVSGKGREARLIPIEAEQAIIVEAKKLHAAGLSLRRVSSGLEERGLLNRLGKPFTAVQVERMVKEHG